MCTKQRPARSGSADKALLVLEALAVEGGVAPLAAIARRANLTKSTTHRVLAVLLDHCMVARSGTDYVLGERLIQLATGSASRRDTHLQQVANPYLVDLYEHVHATVFLGVLHDLQVHYLVKISGLRPAQTPSLVSDYAPAQRTAVGRLLLAYHQRPASTPAAVGRSETTGELALQAERLTIRRTGIALNHGSYAPRVACAATLVVGDQYRPLAGLAVAADITHFNPTRVVRQLRRTACAISAQLGTPTPPDLR